MANKKLKLDLILRDKSEMPVREPTQEDNDKDALIAELKQKLENEKEAHFNCQGESIVNN